MNDPQSSRTKRCISSNSYNIHILPFLPLNYCVEMSSIFINASSSLSSMNQTYPPSCNKPSKAPLKHGNCNPTRNKWTHPFVLRSNSHSFCMGRHWCQTLHSQVLFCLPFHTLLPNWCVVMVILFSIGVWSNSLWFCLWLFVCGFCVFHDIGIYVSLF